MNSSSAIGLKERAQALGYSGPALLQSTCVSWERYFILLSFILLLVDVD